MFKSPSAGSASTSGSRSLTDCGTRLNPSSSAKSSSCSCHSISGLDFSAVRPSTLSSRLPCAASSLVGALAHEIDMFEFVHRICTPFDASRSKISPPFHMLIAPFEKIALKTNFWCCPFRSTSTLPESDSRQIPLNSRTYNQTRQHLSRFGNGRRSASPIHFT